MTLKLHIISWKQSGIFWHALGLPHVQVVTDLAIFVLQVWHLKRWERAIWINTCYSLKTGYSSAIKIASWVLWVFIFGTGVEHAASHVAFQINCLVCCLMEVFVVVVFLIDEFKQLKKTDYFEKPYESQSYYPSANFKQNFSLEVCCWW